MIAKTTIGASLAALLILGTATATFAAERALMTRDTVVYEEDDEDSDEMGIIEEGERVTVLDCDGRWCLIDLRGRDDGWVRKNRLAFNVGPVDRDDDDVDVNLGFGVNSDGDFQFGFGISD